MRTLFPLLAAASLCACSETPSGDAADVKADTLTVVKPPPTSDPIAGDMKDGPVQQAYPDSSKKVHGNMRKGQRHGLWTSYFPDGKPQSSSSYDNGVLNGTSVVFYPNGMLRYTGDYKKGRQVGQWRFYDDQGTLLKTVTYDSTGTVVR